MLRYSSLLLLAASTVLATVLPRNIQAELPAWNFANRTTADATPDGSAGVIIEPDLVVGQPSRSGHTVTKVKFGPYTVNSGQKSTRIILGTAPPCTNCYVTAMQVNLEYTNGKIANVDTGAWLHHIDLTISGQQDYVCPGSLASFGARRIYAAGNERVPVRMNSKSLYGIDLGTGRLAGQLEMMNESVKPISVFMTMTFEWTPKSTPGYKPAMNAWMDVTSCGLSDFAASSGAYQRRGNPWIMKNDGEFLFATGHVHDGGVKVELRKNDKVVCTAKQLYANRRGGYQEPTDGTIVKSMAMPANSHISDTAVCKDFGPVKKGDKLQVVAYYDSNAHMQMKNSRGSLEPQMGITQVYIGMT